MRIAFFYYLNLEYGGGTAKYIVETASGLKKRYPDLEIDILSFSEDLFKKILLLYSVYFFKKTDKKLIYKEDFKNIKKKLGKVNYCKINSFKELRLRLNKYDSIYGINDIVEVFILKLIARNNRLPIIIGFHSPTYYPLASSIQSKLHNIMYGSFAYKFFLKNVKKFHVINSFDEGLLKKRFPDKNIIKIYNPFDFNSFMNESEKYRYDFTYNENKLNVLWAGRLTEQKGINDLLWLIEEINTLGYKDKISWNIIGEGELLSKVINIAKKFKNVSYLGYIENKYMASIYKRNDVFISTSKWEGFPYNVLEAQGCGLPVICYNIAGCNEIIKNNVNGYLANDIEELKNKIIDFTKKKNFDKKYVMEYISDKFEIDNLYKKLYNLLGKE